MISATCTRGMEERAAPLSPSVAVASRSVAKMSSVQVKIFGESNELVRDFAGKVDMLIQPNPLAHNCSISFRDGEWYTWLH